MAGVPQIDVTFDVDVNGILKVSAVDRDSGNAGSITIKSDTSSLTIEEIEQMIEDAEKFAEEDGNFKKRVIARNELEKFAYSIKTQAEDMDGIGRKLGRNDREKVVNTASKELEWISQHQDEEESVYDSHYSRLRSIVWPIIRSLYKDEL